MESDRLEQRFSALLREPGIRVVSFDLFDTLVLRRAFHPEDVFHLMPRPEPMGGAAEAGESAFPVLRRQAEARARQAAAGTAEDVSLARIYDCLDLPEAQRRELMHRELETENSLLFAHPRIDAWIRRSAEAGKRVILVSDMYLSEVQIRDCALSKLQNQAQIQRLYLSSETGKLKATGSLFEHILDEEGIDPGQLLHIGDNRRGDYSIPRHRGIRVLYCGLSASLQRAFEIEQGFLARRPHKLQPLRRLAALDNPYPARSTEHAFFDFGAYVFGPLFWGFSHWLFGLAREHGLNRIHCVMREGGIFKRHLDYLRRLVPDYRQIETALIHASRASLFFPFLDTDGFDDSNLIYNRITIEDFYRLIRIPLDDPLIREHREQDYYKAAAVHLPGGSTLAERIADDVSTRRERIGEASRRQREMLLAYLVEKGCGADSLLVDFGGGGSILRALSAVLGSDGPRLMAMFFKHEKALRHPVPIRSFLPYREESEKANLVLLKYAPVIESLFNGDEQTTLGYVRQDGRVVARTSGRSAGNPGHIEAFDRGIRRFFDAALQHAPDQRVDTLADRLALGEILHRFLKIPTRDEAAAVGTLAFELDAKATRCETYSNQRSRELFKTLGAERYLFQTLTNKKYLWAHTLWPEMELAKHDDGILQLTHCPDREIHPNWREINRLRASLQRRDIQALGVFGIGQFALELLPILDALDIRVDCYLDSRAADRALSFQGRPVITPEQGIEQGVSCFVIASAAFHSQMRSRLEEAASARGVEVEIVTVEEG